MARSIHRAESGVGTARRLPPWYVGAFFAGAIALTWWASSIRLYHGPDHMLGPFHVPIALEWILGGLAVMSAAIGYMWMALTSHPDRGSGPRGAAPTTLFWLACAAVLAAACWRVMTSGVDGVNIGGALIAFGGPFVIASVLHVALGAEKAAREHGLVHSRALAAAVWCAAIAASPVLWLVLV